MAELIMGVTLPLVLNNLVMEFKKALKKYLYAELIEQALEKAPPHLQLYNAH